MPDLLDTEAAYAKSPAPFTPAVLERMFEMLPNSAPADRKKVLDPFAGNGIRFHEAAEKASWDSLGIEIEEEFAAAHPKNIVGDATRMLVFPDSTFDAILTSPTYGNRLADGYAGDAKGSKRFTYRIALGRELSKGNSGAMQWGAAYRSLHALAWSECRRVLKPGGRFVLNVKDHTRDDHQQRVCSWHIRQLLDLGFLLVKADTVETPSMGFGRNGQTREPGELVAAFELDPQAKDGRMF